MRLAGIEKGGYYPYPPHMAEATASWFIPFQVGTRGRILDPYVGEDQIASLLGRLLNCETLGCELFPNRAEQAAAHMHKGHSALARRCGRCALSTWAHQYLAVRLSTTSARK